MSDELHLFRWSEPARAKELLIYARSELDAIEYLAKLPLWWNEQFKPGQFKKVVPPKGPSPSILMQNVGNVISAD